MSLIAEYIQSQQIINEQFDVLFYSEGRNYHIYFEPLFQDLLLQANLKICYISSDAGDPVLQLKNKNLKTFYVKWMLGYVCPKLKADVMIMTMPDLDNFLFKRSPAVKKYIYLFHAAVSTHQQYRKEAFFNYDAVFCTGNYQINELRSTEERYQLPAKELIAYGYPLFNLLQEKKKATTTVASTKKILIAPSWYKHCILNTCIHELVDELKLTGYELLIRSHPEYRKRNKRSYLQLKKKMAGNKLISFDENTDVMDSLLQADILITDRSGIALEYAFGTGRPVLFIDTLPKRTNTSMEEIKIEPVENKIRSAIGISVQPNEIGKIKEALLLLAKQQDLFSIEINKLKTELFFPSGISYQNGVTYILANCKGRY